MISMISVEMWQLEVCLIWPKLNQPFRELCSGKDNQYLLHSFKAFADITFNQVYLKSELSNNV